VKQSRCLLQGLTRLSLEDRRITADLIEVYKIIHGLP